MEKTDIEFIYPDLDWYTQISKDNNLPPRCPYAHEYKCHRYYASRYLLGQAGISTEIRTEKIEELNRFWAKSLLEPLVAEDEPCITNEGSSYSNFCPEISYNTFGLFAEYLSNYCDDIDLNAAHKYLADNAQPKDWRWHWMYMHPLHYSKCPIYSQLLINPIILSNNKEPKELIEIKPGFWGISFNIKEFITRFSKWWLKH